MTPVLSGNPKVLDALTGTAENTSLGLVICSGATRSAFAGGALAYVKRCRLSDRFSSFAAVSGGIGTLVNFMGGAAARSLRMFSEDLSDLRTFNIFRRGFGRYPLDLDYLAKQFDGAQGRGFNFEAAAAHPAPLFAVLGCPATGDPVIIQPRTASEMRAVSIVGGAIPGLSAPCVIDNRPVVDGCFTTASVPVSLLAEQTDVTDVIVFTNRPRLSEEARWGSWIEWCLYHSGYARNVTPRVRELMLSRRATFQAQIETATSSTYPRTLVIWLPYHTPAFCAGEARTAQLIRDGYHTMRMLLTSRSRSHTMSESGGA